MKCKTNKVIAIYEIIAGVWGIGVLIMLTHSNTQ